MNSRPSMFSRGSALPVGTYHVTQTDDGRYTVGRIVGVLCWYPLTQPEDPDWRTWPTYAGAAKWIDDQAEDLCDYPYWGR